MKKEKRISVLLETEGTYPYAGGGVSTWCDILCKELDQIDYYIFAITGTPMFKYKYSLPENVKKVQQVPLWGSTEPSEYILPDIPFSNIYKRKKSTTDKIIENEFVPLFRQLIKQIIQPANQFSTMAKVFHQMYRYFQRFDYKETFKAQAVWETFKNEVFSYYEENETETEEMPSAYDITTTMRWLYYYLMEIQAPIPETDVAHATIAGFSGLMGIISKQEYNTPFIVTDHGVFIRERYIAISNSEFTYFSKKFLVNLSSLVSKLCYVHADLIAPVANFNKRWESRFGANVEKIKTIYNGIDPEVFVPKNKPDKTSGKPTVVAAAHLIPLKDIETMIRSCEVVRKEIPDVKYIVYGSLDVAPDYAEKCANLIKELNVEENFELGGFHSKPSEIYNEGDISALSSISEGFPYTVLESMSCARPVVATDVGGVKEALEGYGVIVKPRDANAFGEGVIKLLKNDEIRQNMGRLAREQVLLKFRNSTSINQYLDAYQKFAFQKRHENETKTEIKQAVKTDLAEPGKIASLCA
jgi:polysaccharide biosynthesis protein PelF